MGDDPNRKKAMEQFHIIGKRVNRPDSIEKVKGQAKFTADLILPGMLTGKILRSTRHHARLLHLDVRPALKVPGVKAVISAKDLPPVVYGFGDRRGGTDGPAPPRGRRNRGGNAAGGGGRGG